MKKILTMLSFFAVVLFLNKTVVAKPAIVKYWAATDTQQIKFWKKYTDEYNKKQDKIKIVVSNIPTGNGSSEDIILTSLATGTAPDFSGNIFSGFAAQLGGKGAIVNLDEMDDFDKLIKERKMEQIIKGWKQKGHTNVFPLYSNPSLFWWNVSLLKKVGRTKAPTTFTEILKYCKELKKIDRSYYVLTWPGDKWWDRWFGFTNVWYASTKGAPYLDAKHNKVLINNKTGIAIAKFLYDGYKSKCFSTAFDESAMFSSQKVGGQQMGIWNIDRIAKEYPNYKYEITSPPSTIGSKYNFGDTKGIVIFKHTKYKKEILKFLTWMFKTEKADLDWLTITRMPPTRGDLSTNPIFVNYYKSSPLEYQKYASYVDYSIPPALYSYLPQLQDIMTNELLSPLKLSKKSPKRAIKDSVMAMEHYMKRQARKDKRHSRHKH